MIPWRLLLWFPASLAIHAAALATVLTVFGTPRVDVLLIDLAEPVAAPPDEPRRTESARRPEAPAPKSTRSGPSPTRRKARPEALPAHRTPLPPSLSPTTLALELTSPEPAPHRLSQQLAATMSVPAPPLATPAPEPMPLPFSPPPQSAPTMTAVPPGPLSESVEPDPPAPASPTPSSTTQGPTPSGSGIDRLESKDKAADDSGQRPGAGTGTTATALAAATDLNSSGEAEYRAYLSLVRLRLLQALQYPRAAREQGLTGTVYLEIFVQPSGAISDVKIVSPSSHQILDRAALEAVRGLPAVRFPPGLAPRPLRARIPVVFDLRSR